jgi:putative protein kinase ArgK-like GTPase of G3E family
MCVVCGCSNTGTSNPDSSPEVHPTTGDLHFGAGAARVSVPGLSQQRTIKIEEDVLGANNAVATQNRAHFAAHGVRALNLVSSPGSGKTTLLCATIHALKQHAPSLAVAVIESVTEGEDKPLKYPDMFAAAQLMILNKIDLLPHLNFDVARCKDYARRVNPGIAILELSATTGEGMQAWLDWLLDVPAHHHDAPHDQQSRQTRIAQLEAELAQLKAGQA